MEKSASLYIHIPFCISKCKYCDFFSQTNFDDDKMSKYIQALCNEIQFRLETYQIKSLKTIYIGGGTPSLLSPKNLNQLFASIKNYVKILSDCEITIEVNPDDITESLLQNYQMVGINRISCGIQSMNDQVLKFSGRRACLEQNLKALDLLKKNWKGKLSLDLICGLPGESKKTFMAGLEKIIEYEPVHISMYSLTFEDKTPFGQALNSGKLDYDFDFADDLWLAGKDFLEKKGYSQYEVSNFAKTGFECRHNLVYWNHEDYLGSGSGATGTVYSEDGQGFRWTNSRNIEEYVDFWGRKDFSGVDKKIPSLGENPLSLKEDHLPGEGLSEQKIPQTEEIIGLEDSIFEFFMMGLRKKSGISSRDFQKIFNQKIPEKILEVFEKWQKNGLCQIYKKNEKTENGGKWLSGQEHACTGGEKTPGWQEKAPASDKVPENHETIYTLGEKGLLFLNKFLEEIIDLR